MRSHPGVAADIFEALADAGINIEIISTSSIRVSCVVRAADAERAVNVIHERLRLADDVLYDTGDDAARVAARQQAMRRSRTPARASRRRRARRSPSP